MSDCYLNEGEEVWKSIVKVGIRNEVIERSTNMTNHGMHNGTCQ